MVLDTVVLVHDIRYFVVAYTLAIATAFLPPSLSGLKIVVAVILLLIYGWYVKRHLDAEADAGEEPLPPLRFHRLDRAVPPIRSSRGCGSWASQVVVALACIVGGAYLFVGAVDRLAAGRGRKRAAACPGDRPDRHRASREVQLADLGPAGQGHARDGQHHRGDGVPVGDPDGGRAGARTESLAW